MAAAVSPRIPFPPMEAELVNELPEGENWQYEPKWDGFRGIVENVGRGFHIWSRNARPLLRYFPELQDLSPRLPPKSAVDGEIVVVRDGRLDFDALQMRLHPAESRVRKLSAEIPAQFVCFDVLLWDGEPVHKLPLEERRARVEKVPFSVSPAERDVGIARLMLGLYDTNGKLLPVGTASAAGKHREEILGRLEPLLGKNPERRPRGEPSRWRPKVTGEWSPVKPNLVVEVRYDKWQGQRIRHGTRFLRFRPDKNPEQCTIDQVRPRPKRGDPTVAGLLAAGQ